MSALVDAIAAAMERAAFDQELPVSPRAIRPLAEAAALAVERAAAAKARRRPLSVPTGFRDAS